MEKECKYCGKLTRQTAGRREKKFCSDRCRSKYWSGAQHDESSKARVSTACEKCGEIFESLMSRGQKYCSHACYISDRFGARTETEASVEESLGSMIKELSKEAPVPEFEESSSAFFDEWDEVKPVMPPVSVRAARADEKLKPKRVYLLAGRYRFQGKYDHFAGLIPLAEQGSLMTGDVYVYCNMQRTQLGVLQWQGDGFALFFKRTEYARYPWPFSGEPKLIEIAPMDLRLLLEMPRLLQRLSGKSPG